MEVSVNIYVVNVGPVSEVDMVSSKLPEVSSAGVKKIARVIFHALTSKVRKQH